MYCFVLFLLTVVICEDGILDEYPYWQVIEHLMQDEKDRAFLERQLDLRNLL